MEDLGDSSDTGSTVQPSLDAASEMFSDPEVPGEGVSVGGDETPMDQGTGSPVQVKVEAEEVELVVPPSDSSQSSMDPRLYFPVFQTDPAVIRMLDDLSQEFGVRHRSESIMMLEQTDPVRLREWFGDTPQDWSLFSEGKCEF